MVPGLFLKGLIIGFSIAAPVGPIGLLCIRRTLTVGRTTGLMSGLGAATADAFYGFIAGFGLTALSSLLICQQEWFRLIGGFFLCYLGLKALFSKPAEQMASAKGKGPMGAYLSTFFLTLTNPMTILSFAAIFAGLGIASSGVDYIAAGILVLGVFLGSALWWLLLSSGVAFFQEKFNLRELKWVNRISGILILFFGLYVLLNVKRS